MSEVQSNTGVEVAERVGLVAMVELGSAHVRAIEMMGKAEELDLIAKATLQARIKGDFKRYREAEAKVNAEIYDTASRKGAKWPFSKDEFLKQASAASKDVWDALEYGE